MEEHLNHKSLPVRYNYTVLSGREDFRSEEHMQSLSPHAASRFYRAVYHFLTTFSVGAIFCIMMSLWDLNRLTSNDMSVSSLVTAAIDKTANLYFQTHYHFANSVIWKLGWFLRGAGGNGTCSETIRSRSSQSLCVASHRAKRMAGGRADV